MTKKSRDEFKYVKTHNELLETLVQKFDALQTHGASFDAGKTWQALTLAGEVQMLVGDGTKQSLLRLLGIQKTLRYPDTARSAVFEQEGWIGSGPMTAILLNENHPRSRGVAVSKHEETARRSRASALQRRVGLSSGAPECRLEILTTSAALGGLAECSQVDGAGVGDDDLQQVVLVIDGVEGLAFGNAGQGRAASVDLLIGHVDLLPGCRGQPRIGGGE